MSLVLRVVLALVVISFSGAEVFAQGSQVPQADVDQPSSGPWKPKRLHLYYRVGVAARINPLGLFLSSTFQLRYRLYDSASAILKDNYIAAGPVAVFSPAFARGGVGVEVQPLSILQLSASYEAIGFFGNFQFNQSFPTASADTSDARLNELQRAGTNYSTYGGVLTLAAQLQAKFGPIAVRSNLRAFNYSIDLRPGDRVWYDPTLDIMSPGKGWTITDDTDLLWVSNFGFAGGLRYTFTHSFFTPQDFAPAELETPGSDALYTLNGPMHRIGPFLAYTFFDDDRRKVNAPTLVLLAQWHLRHRYRAGQASSQAFPTIAIAFQFKGII